MNDLRFALRQLVKSPGFTLVALATLALGIGANTTIFTWVQAVLFRPIPMAADPSTIRVAAMENREGASRSWSYPNFRDFRDRATLMDVVAQDDQTFNVAAGETAERSWGGLVSGNFFQVMGIRPAAGRFFTPTKAKACTRSRSITGMSSGTRHREPASSFTRSTASTRRRRW